MTPTDTPLICGDKLAATIVQAHEIAQMTLRRVGADSHSTDILNQPRGEKLMEYWQARKPFAVHFRRIREAFEVIENRIEKRFEGENPLSPAEADLTVDAIASDLYSIEYRARDLLERLYADLRVININDLKKSIAKHSNNQNHHEQELL